MIEYNFYPEHHFILTIFYGKVNHEELNDLVDKLQKIEHDGSQMRGLTILSKNTKPKGIKANHIMNAGERMQHVTFRKDGKNAIVSESLLAYGLARMYKVATDIMNLDELKIYKENGLDDAIEWLEVGLLKDQIIEVIERCRYCESNP